jgi:hypothetical protein
MKLLESIARNSFCLQTVHNLSAADSFGREINLLLFAHRSKGYMKVSSKFGNTNKVAWCHRRGMNCTQTAPPSHNMEAFLIPVPGVLKGLSV